MHVYTYSSKHTKILLHIIMYAYLSIEIPIRSTRDVPSRVLYRVVHWLGQGPDEAPHKRQGPLSSTTGQKYDPQGQ